MVHTVFLECGAEHRTDGPPELRPVGETEFVAAAAEESRPPGGADDRRHHGTADLRSSIGVDAALAAHEAARRGWFRGVPFITAHECTAAARATHAGIKAPEPPSRGVSARLGDRDLTYDTWHYHSEPRVRSSSPGRCPDTTMVLDHFGTPIGVGP